MVALDMFKHDLGEGAELRILEPRHAKEFFEFVCNNISYLSQFLPWGETITNVQQAEEFVSRSLIRYQEDGLPWIGIWQNNKMAGGILFFPVDRRVNATEIGYWLGQEFSGRGLMLKAIQAVLPFVFDVGGINRIALHADVANTKSRALAERLGFQFEGIERQSWILREKYTDNALYALLRDDWKNKKP